MLIYFSATGNTKHVVDIIKQEDEKVISIEEATREADYRFKLEDDRLGILTPTYDWGLPSIVYDFLEKLEVIYDQKPYVFYVGTFGTTTGGASCIADTILKSKGLMLDAKFDIRMPDTWTVLFDLSDTKKVSGILDKANDEIVELKDQLTHKEKGKHMDITVPELFGRIGKLLYDQNVRKTDHLSVSDQCIGCTLCAKKCPVQAIEMRNNKPVWVKEQCTMCLGCLHRCPKYAIYYGNGKATNAHGQYVYSWFDNHKGV